MAGLAAVGSCQAEGDGASRDGDWPEWGGSPSKNMVSRATGIPIDFDPGKRKKGSWEINLATTRRCDWVAKIGSRCFGTPTVAAGKVLIGTDNGSPRDHRVNGYRGVLMCFDEKTGNFEWQLIVRGLSSVVGGIDSRGMCSSALIHRNRAYVVTNRCQVMCLDLDGLADGNDGPFQREANLYADRFEPPAELSKADADVIWIFDMRSELGVFPHGEIVGSPTLVDGKLAVTTANGTDWSHTNVPSPDAPCLITLDPETGKLIGEDRARIGAGTLHNNWSSPSAGKIDGEPAIFFGGGDGFAYSFDPDPVEDDEGFLVYPENWRIDGNPPEYRRGKKFGHDGGPSEIIGTPVLHKGHIYFAIGQDHETGKGPGMLSCVDAKTGERVWESKEVGRSMSTPSIVGGLLYIADFRGHVHCFDVKSGKRYWSFDTGRQIWGSTLVVDGKVLVGNEDGELVILAAGKDARELARVEFETPIYSTPVVANGRIYIATQANLFAFRK